MIQTEEARMAAAKEMEKEFSRERTRGYIVNCDGEHAVIYADVKSNDKSFENYWSVGQLISIKVGVNRVVGLCCGVDVPSSQWQFGDPNSVHVKVELVGEICAGVDGEPDRFSSGITHYPQMGCIAHKIRATDLEVIYRSDGDAVVSVGNLTQDPNVPAKIDIDKLLSRHFAVVGTTGVGKSTSVTLLMRKIIEARPEVRILMLDPHNEFASAFPDKSVVVDSSNLLLPYWLFRLEEFCEVVFRGQSGFEAEAELLRDLIPHAKERYKQETNGSKVSSLVRKNNKSAFTADVPVPYRLIDLLKLIDERLGLLEGKAEKPILKSLQYRLESISTDPRFRFMFDQGSSSDSMEEIVSQIFRVPTNGKPICVLEMSGLPSEVVNAVVSVLCRMAFDLAMNSDGAIQTLVVCEEAHRYIPADSNAGFWPTRQSIARIAKEGRKYGVFLSIITQRPGELDPTILSQCNTVFAMRLGNERDQEIIRGAVTNGAKSTIGFLSSIANRECIAFGEAIHTPMRMTFETIRKEDLPGARIYEQQEAVRDGKEVPLSAVLRKMRQEERRHANEDEDEEVPVPLAEQIQTTFAGQGVPGDDINDILNAAVPNTPAPQPVVPSAPMPQQAVVPPAPPQPAMQQPMAPAAPVQPPVHETMPPPAAETMQQPVHQPMQQPVHQPVQQAYTPTPDPLAQQYAQPMAPLPQHGQDAAQMAPPAMAPNPAGVPEPSTQPSGQHPVAQMQDNLAEQLAQQRAARASQKQAQAIANPKPPETELPAAPELKITPAKQHLPKRNGGNDLLKSFRSG